MKKALIFAAFILIAAAAMAQDSTKADTSKKFSQRLAEVTVTAKRPLMTQEIDKTIVDVKAMAGSASLNTIELLERIPGVNVSPSGEISLNGKQGVMVMVDGRNTYMSAQDLISYLKSIPAGNLDKVELIDNPSARFDASGNAVINLKLRKNRDAGFNGNFSAGASQGRYPGTNNSLNLNYNRKKLNLFANIGVSTFKEYNDDHYDRKFFNTDNSLASIILLDNDQVLQSKNANLFTGFDYSISPKSSLGLNLNLNKGRRDNDFLFVSDEYDASGNIMDRGNGFTNGVDKRTTIGANLNYLLQLNQNGHELSADINVLRYEQGSDRPQGSMLTSNTGQVIENEMFQYIVPTNSDITVLKADYVKPFKSKLKLEAGVKSSFIKNDNQSNYYNIENGVKTFDPAFSNHFKYDENINAAYINLQKTWTRLQGQFGLRMEHLDANGDQLGNEVVSKTVFHKTNVGLFPSATISYKLDTLNKNTLSLFAVRRISRPNYSQLNPFIFQKDEFTSTSGNPDLNPQYQYRLELKFQHKQLYWFQVSYNRFESLVFHVSKVQGERYINRPENIGSGFMVLLSSGLNLSPVRWWNSNNTLRIARLGANGTVDNLPLKPRLYAIRFETWNSFTISKTVSAEAGAYFASKDVIGQAYAKAMFRVNAGVQKKIWKEKGSVRLGVDDIFHSWQYRNTSIGLHQASYYMTNVMDTRRITAAFTYRFGSEAKSKKRRQGSVNDDEKGRLD